jgi:hypothetical protein
MRTRSRSFLSVLAADAAPCSLPCISWPRSVTINTRIHMDIIFTIDLLCVFALVGLPRILTSSDEHTRIGSLFILVLSHAAYCILTPFFFLTVIALTIIFRWILLHPLHCTLLHIFARYNSSTVHTPTPTSRTDQESSTRK